MENYCYFDNAATTRLSEAAFESMKEFLVDNYANPSSIYGFARRAKSAIYESRSYIASTLNASYDEIYFTSGGSEADNWAIRAAAYSQAEKGKHIISSKIEHHAVLNTLKALEREGFEVTYLDVSKKGIIDVESLKSAIRPDTILISIMCANNEIGTLQPIKEIGMLAKKNDILFHTDEVAAYAHMRIDVKACGIDMLSASAHKFNGPKGTGFLYIRTGVKTGAFIYGGIQERGMRAGTENVAAIAGMHTAAREAFEQMAAREEKVREVSFHIRKNLISRIKGVKINGDTDCRLCSNINICIDGVSSESLLILLDSYGICVSAGSACASGALTPSHVLKAIGLSDDEARGSVRITVSHLNNIEEADFLAESLEKCVNRLRGMAE